MSDVKKNFGELEGKIQKLILSHQQLLVENESLKKENVKLGKIVAEGSERVKWMEEGYLELNDAERVKTGRSISGMQKRIEEIVSEIDQSMSLFSTQNK